MERPTDTRMELQSRNRKQLVLAAVVGPSSTKLILSSTQTKTPSSAGFARSSSSASSPPSTCSTCFVYHCLCTTSLCFSSNNRSFIGAGNGAPGGANHYRFALLPDYHHPVPEFEARLFNRIYNAITGSHGSGSRAGRFHFIKMPVFDQIGEELTAAGDRVSEHVKHEKAQDGGYGVVAPHVEE